MLTSPEGPSLVSLDTGPSLLPIDPPVPLPVDPPVPLPVDPPVPLPPEPVVGAASTLLPPVPVVGFAPPAPPVPPDVPGVLPQPPISKAPNTRALRADERVMNIFKMGSRVGEIDDRRQSVSSGSARLTAPKSAQFHESD
jgi:hypothetical protein